MSATGDGSVWGTDGVVSLPTPTRATSDTVVVDMGGFVFTPHGLGVNITEVDREELLRSGYGPRDPGGATYG